MSPVLLELNGLCRVFPGAREGVAVLRQLDLQIRAGEMVAIVGASGSGKSTLMNILGCLDRPTSGSYRVAGQNTADLSPDALARLRREHFGFIFQRYHLLSDLTAQGNVEMPAVYAGVERTARRARAQALLQRLGMADRVDFKPGQLSGGQQQRVSIARALMNGGQVILADEPTGALDRHNGAEVMTILRELNDAGQTIIIVTHDMDVARHARRIIELSDGEIVADRSSADHVACAAGSSAPLPVAQSAWQAERDRARAALRMSLLAMNAHRMRSFLTMLGIIIGIASVVSVVALGTGSRQQVLRQISEMGTNTIEIYSGSGAGDQRVALVPNLTPADVDALAQENYVDSVTPNVTRPDTVRFRNIALNVNINGVGEQYFRVRGLRLVTGAPFSSQAIRHMNQEAIIDATTREKLFVNGEEPIGQVIWLKTMPVRVVGVAEKQSGSYGANQLNIWVPYTTVIHRMLGPSPLDSITVRVRDDVAPATAEGGIVRLLTVRHKVKDFSTYSLDKIRQTVERTTAVLSLLISMIAFISLVVGGIGVMNIMLVSVTERTREIGVRMAVGARQGDIMKQFLIESVLVCLLGGIVGVALALSLGLIFSQAGAAFPMIFSFSSLVAAFACSSAIGMLFGYLPARNAARLDPARALARE